MAEYIGREALENAMTIAAVNGKEKDRRTWAKAICVLHDMPTADVAPVVRCRDCKYLVRATVNSNGFLICNVSDMEITLEDFCSYGEKMDRGEENG